MGKLSLDKVKKYWHLQRPVIRKIIILVVFVCLVVLFIITPLIWQYLKHNHEFRATIADVFAGNIDWSAWWEFGTFLVAIVAAMVAFGEYKSHQHQLLPRLVPIIEVTRSTDFLVNHYLNCKLAISNVGGGVALEIRAYWECNDEKPRSRNCPTKADLQVSVLKPNTEHTWFNNTGNENYTFPYRGPWKKTTQLQYTLHITWKDDTGNSYEYPIKGEEGLTASVQFGPRIEINEMDLSSPPPNHILKIGYGL